MPAENKARVKKFYESVFGWQMTQLGAEMSNYLLATTSPVDENNMHKEKGAINGGFYDKGEAGTMPHVVISVPDIAKHVELVKSGGGTIESEIIEIPGIGKYAMFKDTEGNRVAMLEPVQR